MTSRRLLLTQELLLPSLQAGYIQHREQEARRIVFCRWIEEEDTKGISGKPPCRQASTATTGTEKSEATVHTTLSTIPEVSNSRGPVLHGISGTWRKEETGQEQRGRKSAAVDV